MGVLAGLQPERIFYYFEEMLAIPRETYNTKEASDYCVAFAKEHGLWFRQDESNNVIIKKPGTAGYEDKEPIIVQGHLDMVCTKVPQSTINFKTDGIEAIVEDGFVKANGTSLGADNGIAIAMILTLLESNDIPHPPIEAIMTSDEEDGLLGAQAIDMSDIEGTKLLNIDGEEEGVLTIGCSGGIRGEMMVPLSREEKAGDKVTIHIHGLRGGHSGADIHLQRGNAHKMIGRLLNHIANAFEISLVGVNGGQQDNVVANDSTAEIIVKAADTEAVVEKIATMGKIFFDEFMGEEPDLKVDVDVEKDVTASVCDADSTNRAITFLVICPNGVVEYSRKLAGLVESSLNMGAVKTTDDLMTTAHYLRSSVDTKDDMLWESIVCAVKAVGGTASMTTSYLAWPMKLDTELQKIMMEVYKDMYHEDTKIVNLHAGLEPALFFLKKPELECISFGPNIYDVHSVNEKMDIASVGRTWEYILEILKRC